MNKNIIIKFKNGIKPIDVIICLPLLFCFISAVFPPLRVRGNNALYCLICYFVWLVFTFLQNRNWYLRSGKNSISCFFFIIYTCCIPYLFGSGVIANRYISLMLMPLGYIIYNYYKENKKLHVIKVMINIVMIFILITFFRTFFGLLDNPYLSRSIKSVGEYSKTVLSMGYGGYEFAYFITLISMFLFQLFLTSKSAVKKTLYITTYILSVIFVLLSNYFTAFILILLSVGILIFSKFRSKTKWVLLIVLIILFLVLSESVLGIILDILGNHFTKGKLYYRLSEMEGAFLNSFMKDFTADRLPTLYKSLNTIYQYPLLGLITTKMDMVNISIEDYNFGQHSHILDSFALFGIAVGIWNLFICFKVFNKKYFKSRYKNLSYAFLCSVIILLTFNNLVPACCMVITIFYPYFMDKSEE